MGEAVWDGYSDAGSIPARSTEHSLPGTLRERRGPGLFLRFRFHISAVCTGLFPEISSVCTGLFPESSLQLPGSYYIILKEMAEKNYTAKSGSVIITLNSSFLEKLNPGYFFRGVTDDMPKKKTAFVIICIMI